MRPFRAAILAAFPLAALAAGPALAQPLVDPAWVAAHKGAAHVVIVDIRPAAAYAAGHVPGAIGADYEHAGWRQATPGAAGGALPPVAKISAMIGGLGIGDADHAVIVADDFGAAARVYWTFRVLGHADVSILNGGWSAWTARAGDPVSTEATTRPAATFTAHYDPSIRAQTPEVAQAVGDGAETLVDARPPAQWNGTAKTPVVHAYGHLPGAVWVNQSEALAAPAALKPKAELAALFSKVPAGKPATTYCNTGHLAATDWFVLSEVLHRPGTKLYDGSLSEWTADPSRPMVR